MADFADLVIDGALCCFCAVALDGDAPGFLRICEDCLAEGLSLDVLSDSVEL